MVREEKEWIDEFQVEGAFLEDIDDAIKHGILVSNIAYSLSKILDLDQFFLEEMKLAGMMHDIGKLKIGKFLYGRQKNALKVEEMKHMQRHPVLGYEMLQVKSFSTECVLRAIYHHHENYDGSGYPDNLRGTAIPLGARILRISDVFAALVSERPYREAFDQNMAMELMIDEVKNFDMELFLAFMSMVNSEEFLEIQEYVQKINENKR